jgi:acid phosphatase (class A)
MRASGVRVGLAVVTAAAAGMLVAAANQPGYLTSPVDISIVVPPPPQKGDARYEADRTVFRVTRRLLSTPRGALAVRDVAWKVPDLMRDFSCAFGLVISPERTPALYRLLATADAETAKANDLAKNKWKRPRPFLIDNGAVCQNKADLAKSYDYPSGHTTRGWTAGLILADLRPDRAPQILARARAYGESRIVCGAHNMSAVEAGRLGATISMQKIRLSDQYLADVAAAKAELQSLASDPESVPSGAVCSAEEALVAPSIYAGLVPGALRRR